MTLANENTCLCSNKNCSDCKCGCSKACCSKPTTTSAVEECPFMKAHPNWQKCPFMRNMFMSMQTPVVTNTEAQISVSDHSTCDASKCANIPMTQCTSCHHNATGLNHTVTLAMDTEQAADRTEETAL